MQSKPTIAIVAIIATLSLLTAKVFFAVTTIGAVALTWTVVFAPLLVYLAYVIIVAIAAVLIGIALAALYAIGAWWTMRRFKRSVRTR
ncbi:hypothetical protein IVIADoCa7_21 [Xanthomonas phage vB_Xar_IVIA-DoCa7]|uniref:Uncharacterized protein n=1 Tax=Xanthomonas phage vB_Xar_IVIA-DoCa7 TaxID=2975534 RepID=A0A9X9JN40_9CAUD|nr:hypothetical protein IVIADoCa7_21 [Xanthomonas phage vB_Xar_IVIA-DoCa7]